MPPKAHTGLCWAEKNELDRLVREMYEAVSALDNACRTVRVGDENYAGDCIICNSLERHSGCDTVTHGVLHVPEDGLP